MKQKMYNGMKHVNVNVKQMQMFLMINNVGIMINFDANEKNYLIKVQIDNYRNCTCKKSLVDKLVDECTETVKEVNPAVITLAENENSYKYNSCIVYTVLFWIFFIIFVGIGAYFAYYKYRNRKKMILDIMKQLFTKLIKWEN